MERAGIVLRNPAINLPILQADLWRCGMGTSSGRSPRQVSRQGRHLRSGDWRMLHGLSRLLVVLQQFKRSPQTERSILTVAERRRHQRQRMVRQLAEANPDFQQFTPRVKGWWLWQGLRWGGPAVLMGWWLAQAARG